MEHRRAWLMVAVGAAVIVAAVLTPVVFDLSWR
jgi:hypothetical protein